MADKILNSFDVWITAQGLKSKGRIVSIDNISLEGVSRLRQLIIKLAVRGKLAQQDLRETVSETFEENETYFETNLDELKIDTPPNWKVVFVEQCFTIKSGSTVEASKELENGNYLYLKVADLNLIGNEKDINISSRYLNPNEKELRAAIPSGSIVFPKRGGAIATNKKKLVKKDLFVDLNIMSISPKKGIDLNYAFYWLQGIDLAKLNSGTSVPQINHKDVGPLVFPIPPIQEQHRIVAKVDELMALCDELEQQETNHLKTHQLLVETLLGTLTQAKDAAEFQTAWATLSQHFDDLFITEDSIDQLKQTILQLAVMGKLVPQDPKDEPASVLLEKIRKEKERLVGMKKIKKEKPLSSITDFDKPFELPEKWMWCRFGDLLRSMAYGTSQKTDNNEQNVPVLRMGNITSEGKLTYGNLKYINPDHEDLPNLYLENGDIVFNRTNSYELVGKSGVYKGDSNRYTLASYLIKASPFVEMTNSDFLNLYINSPICRKTQIEPEITAQTNQANFSGSKLKNILFPLPPLKEQDRIVERIDELFVLCDSLKERVEETQKVAKQMANSILEQVD